MSTATTPLSIALPAGGSVSGLLMVPPACQAAYVFAHGAGAGMNHAFMAQFAQALADRGIATLRYQFPYMEQGGKRPDTPAVAHAAVRSAAAECAKRLPGVPLFAGGKSFGGRMTSQAQAAEPLAEVRGLVFVGFPLHPPQKPSVERAAHLSDVKVPMLFLQGTRDELADHALVRATVETLGARATLHVEDGGDHSFHVLVRSGRSDAQVMQSLADATAAWMRPQLR